jgi:hypothetical protein
MPDFLTLPIAKFRMFNVAKSTKASTFGGLSWLGGFSLAVAPPRSSESCTGSVVGGLVTAAPSTHVAIGILLLPCQVSNDFRLVVGLSIKLFAENWEGRRFGWSCKFSRLLTISRRPKKAQEITRGHSIVLAEYNFVLFGGIFRNSVTV